jgi:SAM-dependent methyltransferase
MPEIDRTEGRRAFGHDPAGYEAARPDYPPEIYDILIDRCGLRPGAHAFEIGPGPGLATRHLLELGASPLTVIEPDQRLAEFLADRLGPLSANLDIHVASFEDVQLPLSTFDLGVSASSFHWVDEEVGLRKVARLLRPGGWWAMWWNVFGETSTDDPFHHATQRLMKGWEQPPASGPNLQPGFALDIEARKTALQSVGGFTDISCENFRRTIVYDSAKLKALYATFSAIALLDAVDRRKLLDEIESIADRDFGGRVERPIVTPIYLAYRI